MDVTFDHLSFLVDGQRQLLISGEIHYARAPRQLWPALLDRSVALGLNTIASYVFWNWHEPERDVYDFSGDRDLGHFLDLCAERHLSVILRAGPYCCAEWNYGGYPAYLRQEPGITIRTWSEPYLRRVEKYFRHLVPEFRRHLASQGGPVILVQIENEYANVAKRYGEAGQRYLAWLGKLAGELGIDVPMIMCEGGVEGTVETVNGHSISAARVAQFRAAHPSLPMVWTELWPAWYDTWGFQHHRRDPRNIAWHLLDFIGQGGSGWNYYMWYGGTNFGRTSMYLQTTSYDFDAPLDEWGQATLKGVYLGKLHHLLASQADLLLAGKRERRELPDGGTSVTWRENGRCLTLRLDGQRRLAELADGSGNILFDSVRQFDQMQRTWRTQEWQQLPPLRAWRRWSEPRPSERPDPGLRSPQPVEQLSLTGDRSDYCWYSTILDVDQTGEQELELPYAADLLYVFLNGRLVASSPPPFIENRGPTRPASSLAAPTAAVNLLESQVGRYGQTFRFAARCGRQRLDLLATALGLVKGDWMVAGPMNTECKGIWQPVRHNGRTVKGWTMRPGLVGEKLRIPQQPAVVRWGRGQTAARPCTWLLAAFRLTPAQLAAEADFRLDAAGLGKGMLFVNGHALGRHWLIPADGYGADQGWQHLEIDALSLAPAGQPTQRYYQIPRAWLAARNHLVIFEEQAGRPAAVRLEMRRRDGRPG